MDDQTKESFSFWSGFVVTLFRSSLTHSLFCCLQVDSFLPDVDNRIGALLISTQQRLVR